MLDAIAHRQGHAITTLHANRQQAIGKPIDPRIELRVSRVAKLVPRRDLERKFPGVTAQAVAHQHWNACAHISLFTTIAASESFRASSEAGREAEGVRREAR